MFLPLRLWIGSCVTAVWSKVRSLSSRLLEYGLLISLLWGWQKRKEIVAACFVGFEKLCEQRLLLREALLNQCSKFCDYTAMRCTSLKERTGGWLSCWLSISIVLMCMAAIVVVIRRKRRPKCREPLCETDAEFIVNTQLMAEKMRDGIEKLARRIRPRTDDPELLVNCPQCRGVFVHLTNPSIAELLFAALDENIAGEKVLQGFHVCPFENDDTPPLYVAKLLGLVSVLALRYREKGLPEGKSKKNRDLKHYVRGGKFRSGKEWLRDEDYANIIDAVERGKMDDALEFLLDAQGVGGEEMPHNPADRARYISQLNEAVFQLTRNTDTAAERAFYEGWGNAVHRRFGMPEGMPTSKLPVVLPEAGLPAQLLAVGEHWQDLVTEERIKAHKVACATTHQAHRAVTMSEKTSEPVTMVPEAFAVPIQNQPSDVVSISTGVGKATSRSRRKRKDLPEGPVASSLAVVTDDIVAAVTFAGDRTMQGYLCKGPSSQVLFVTGRHRIVDTPEGRRALDGFEGTFAKHTVVVHRPGRPDTEVQVVGRAGSGDDLVVLKLVGVLPDVQTRRVRSALPGTQVRARYYDVSTKKWCDLHGPVRAVLPNCVVYEMSTIEGCCRMPIFDTRGFVVAGHYYPRVDIGVGAYPGGFPEPERLPIEWTAKYTMPMFVPQGAGPMDLRGPFQRVEKFKITGLRDDINLSNVKTEFFMAKPSTEMLRKELAKFYEPLRVDISRERTLSAVAAACQIDADGAMPYRHPELSDFIRLAIEMDNERTNAGSEAIGQNHREYLMELGDGDLNRGYEVAATRAYDLYRGLVGTRELTADDRVDLYMFKVWMVQGKRDGYKLKKLKIGRSIQAPCFTFKLMHKAMFESADTHWISRQHMFRVGYDMDMPVPMPLVYIYKETLASIGLDESGFDRCMPREFMEAYFLVYLPYMTPGVPHDVLKMMADATINSHMLMTDGFMYEKERGNPSGYPNTLRLNCIVQLIAWCYAMSIRLEQLGKPSGVDDVVAVFERDIFLEICGDDSRANAQTQFGCQLLDAHSGFVSWLNIWEKELPWAVKIEGSVTFSCDGNGFLLPFEQRMAAMPPIVSRNLVVIDDVLWSPLWNTDRCVRKLVSRGTTDVTTIHGRTDEEEYVLILSAFMTLKLHTYWHLEGKIYCPTVQFLLDNHWFDAEMKRLVYSCVTACYREAIARRMPCSSLP